MTNSRITTVLLDVDGTLVDSNDAHAAAWVRAFAEHGVTVSAVDVRRAIGMGGDHLMPSVSDVAEASPLGQQIAARRKEIFSADYLPELRAFEDAGALVAALEARGYTVVVASSARKQELKRLLRIAGAERLIDNATSNDDAEESKPSPDIVEAALRQAQASAADAVMIGDTPYDVQAARRAGVRAIAFRSGGWSEDDLRGAIAVYDGPWDLLARLDDSPLGPPAGHSGERVRPEVP